MYFSYIASTCILDLDNQTQTITIVDNSLSSIGFNLSVSVRNLFFIEKALRDTYLLPNLFFYLLTL